MKLKAGFVAGALALALAGGYTFREVRSTQETARRKQAEERVFDILPEDVASVSVERQGERVKLQRAPEGWRLVEPVSSATDGEVTSEVLRLIGASSITHTVEDSPGSPERYGLGPVSTRVSVRARSGVEKSIEVGLDAPTEQGVYVRRPGSSAVLLAGTEVRDLSELDPRLVMERTLLPRAAESVKIEIRTATGSVLMVKGAAGWELREPFLFAADAGRVEELLSTFARLRAEPPGSQPASAGGAGLSPPRIVALFSAPLGETVQFTFGEEAAANRIWARRGNEESFFLVDKKVRTFLKDQPEDWCEKRPAAIDRYKVNSLKMRWGSGWLLLSRDTSGWHDDKGKPLPEPLVLGLLAALCDSPSSRIEIGASPPVRSAPPLFADVREEGGRRRVIEGWGPDGEGNWRLRPRGHGAALVMTGSSMKLLETRLNALLVR